MKNMKLYRTAYARASDAALMVCHTLGLIEMAGAGMEMEAPDSSILNIIAVNLEAALDDAEGFLKYLENRKENAG